jgi:serine/threonine-protein kinase
MERSLGLAGSIIRARYRVNAVASVSRDVVVYAAEELRYGRPIALKVLRDEVAGDAEFVAAARDQATTLAMSARAHRGLPRVYECGAADTGELFIALEPVKGATLREVLDARGALGPYTALRIASQVGEALETLHHSRIVHGQLDPESVLLVKDGDGMEHVTLTGVELTAAYRTASGRRRRETTPPAYLAPEQVEGGEATDATDQYALGMLLRELLTATRSPETSSLPPEIERIIATATDARPERRFPDVSVMVNDMWAVQTTLAETAPGPPSVKPRASIHRRQRRRRSQVPLRIAGAVAAAGIIAVVVWFALSGGLGTRARALLTAPAVTAVPVGQELAHPAAAPRPAPAVERQPQSGAPAVEAAPPRPAESRTPGERDGSGVIDWLLKTRR